VEFVFKFHINLHVMRGARIYDFRNDDTDYPNMLAADKTFIFCGDDMLKKTQPGEVVFFVNRKEKEALYAVATAATRIAVRNQRTWLKEFEFEGQIYGAREGDDFLKYEVRQVTTIPSGWRWEKPLRRNPTAHLWTEGKPLTQSQLIRLNDLRRLFSAGPAQHLLAQYLMPQHELNGSNKASGPIEADNPVKDAATTKSNAIKPPNTRSVHTGCRVVPTVISFEHPYRKLIMAIRTKPFVLLSGVSGTGKSWTARKLAYLTCSHAALRSGDRPGNFEMVSVRPDWSEPDDLLGYHTTQGGFFCFHGTDLLRFIVKAWQYPEVPFFVCLDEMNLAQAEHYFSAFLSKLQTARPYGTKTIYDPFFSSAQVAQYNREDPSFWAKLGLEGNMDLQEYFLTSGIAMPDNLVIIGTVNMDETTQPLSARLLDRALVIEMKRRSLYEDLTAPAATWEYPQTYELAAFLTDKRLDRYAAFNQDPQLGMRIIERLERLYTILDGTPFALAERVKHDTLVYCFLHKALFTHVPFPDKWLNYCLDEIICMKVLVRIAGDADTCSRVVQRLLQVTTSYKDSHQKLLQMQSDLENGGYTSFR
jgi:hypothetical protein